MPVKNYSSKKKTLTLNQNKIRTANQNILLHQSQNVNDEHHYTMFMFCWQKTLTKLFRIALTKRG